MHKRIHTMARLNSGAGLRKVFTMSYDKQTKPLQRFHTKRVIKKRVKDWNNYPHAADSIQHTNKWNKRNAFNCGRARCHLCCNPRRLFGHVTVYEISALEAFKYELCELNSH